MSKLSTFQRTTQDVVGRNLTLAQGTYYETINLAGKNITIQGSDPNNWDVVEATIIDASGLGPAITFAGTEDPNCHLTGITVTGGLAGQRDGLVAYWNMDETTGTTAFDGSANAYDGSLIDGPTWDSNGVRLRLHVQVFRKSYIVILLTLEYSRKEHRIRPGYWDITFAHKRLRSDCQ